MADVVVWSERGELHAKGWKDCVYSSVAMAMVFGGFTKFPLGAYTDPEREALERSDDQPDEVGASIIDGAVACLRRYKDAPHTIPAEGFSLAKALDKKGTILALTGVNGRLPAGHVLRRWDPSFVGAHAIAVKPLGGGKSLWLDPEAPNKYKGDTVANATVLKWADGLRNTIRVVTEDEFVPLVVDPKDKIIADLKTDLAHAQSAAAAAQSRGFASAGSAATP